MESLGSKTALVTGASRGIGRGIAVALAEEGATVGVNHPPSEAEREAASEVVSTIRAEGGDAIAIEGDVRNSESVEAMVRSFIQQRDRIDILVNNAGILTQAPLEEMSIKMWDETIDVDLRSVFLVTRAVLPGMLDSGDGKIINIASQLGLKGGEELTHYSAAKAGVIGFTRALAREVAPTVNVNAIAPGPIETGMLNDLDEEWKEAKIAELPMNRLGQVSDVTPTAVFLASDDSDYYTGQVLSPDGGDVMH